MRVLLVEDDDLFGSAVQKALAREGWAVDWLQRGRDLDHAMRQADYDCLLLDLNLPDLSGEDALKAVRARSPGQSVIVMTARGSVTDRIRLLDLGADDFVPKPVDLDEVAARVRAVTRRAHHAPAAAELVHGPLRLHTDRRMATWHGRVVPLTNKEFWLLEILVRRKAQIHSRARLEESLYGWGEETASNTVEVYVHYPRRKFHKNLIRTIRGAGYQIGPEDRYVD